jgi:hypothetical protein
MAAILINIQKSSAYMDAVANEKQARYKPRRFRA